MMMANTMPTPHSPTHSSGLHFYAEPEVPDIPLPSHELALFLSGSFIGVLIGMALRGMMK
jgi:hypothetical protein